MGMNDSLHFVVFFLNAASRYDQGVMSQVNLNPDYQTHMGINPVEGTYASGGPV